MDAIISTLGPLLANRLTSFGIRELARATGINHTTVRQRLTSYEMRGYVQKVVLKHGTEFQLADTVEAKLLKQYVNLHLFYSSGLFSDLQRHFDHPVIVLFGSFARGEDVATSDVDVAVFSQVKRPFASRKYFEKEIDIHVFCEKKWQELLDSKHELVNSIANGHVLSGHLRVM